MLGRPRKLDGPERARLLAIAVEAVVGEIPPGLSVGVRGDDAALTDPDGVGFRIGNAQVLQRGEEPFLERAVAFAVDGLGQTPQFRDRVLPLCPAHPDEHPLEIEIGHGVVVGSCPLDGIVRVVRYR